MSDGSVGEQILALFLVVTFSLFGGILIRLLGGLKVPRILCIGPYKTKPLLTKVTIPDLVGMIICGCLARNFFGSVMDAYNDEWGGLIRMVSLCVILLRGGLELDFKGKGLVVVLLTLCPQACEATAVALVSKGLLSMPWSLCFALGFIVGAVSPAVLVPSCMLLQDGGYGAEKGIPTTLIAASSFDDIIAITIFGICSTVAFNQLGTSDESPVYAVFVNIYQIAAGLAVGLMLGLLMKLVRSCNNVVKLIIVLGVAFMIAIVSELIHFHESRYIGVIFYGYMCYRFWGEDKPDEELA